MNKLINKLLKPYLKQLQIDFNEILQERENNLFTNYDLIVIGNNGLREKVGFANLSFKPSPGDKIEFDETVSREKIDPKQYFIFRVHEVIYSHYGFSGRLIGEIISS